MLSPWSTCDMDLRHFRRDLELEQNGPARSSEEAYHRLTVPFDCAESTPSSGETELRRKKETGENWREVEHDGTCGAICTAVLTVENWFHVLAGSHDAANQVETRSRLAIYQTNLGAIFTA